METGASGEIVQPGLDAWLASPILSLPAGNGMPKTIGMLRPSVIQETPKITSQALAPIRFEPILKRLIWGGRRLGTVLDKAIGEGNDYAESWEVADHRQGQSRVAFGPLAGTSLNDLVRFRGEELLGPAIFEKHREQFPLLVKFIDARQALSVQVHPDDEKGRRLANDNGKTETWVVLHAEPGSLIYSGLRPGVNRQMFSEALVCGEVEPLLHRFEARSGDSILIPAGTVHAIGSGVLLAEVQQMSDATFRVFDWNRVGTDGQPRPLHITEALESIDFARGPVDPLTPQPLPFASGTREALASCPFFALERLRLTAPATVGAADQSKMTLLIGLEGRAQIVQEGTAYSLEPGETLLLPASTGTCPIVPEGSATVLTCTIP